MILVVYGNVIPKIDFIKFLIPVIIFSLAIFNILSLKKLFRSKRKYVLIFAVLFGFFNGLGTSTDLLLLIGRYESELIPIIEVAFGTGISVLIIVLGVLTVITLLRKVVIVHKKMWTLLFSIIIIGLSIPLMLGQIFN